LEASAATRRTGSLLIFDHGESVDAVVSGTSGFPFEREPATGAIDGDVHASDGEHARARAREDLLFTCGVPRR
jgi:hypothetical protein